MSFRVESVSFICIHIGFYISYISADWMFTPEFSSTLKCSSVSTLFPLPVSPFSSLVYSYLASGISSFMKSLRFHASQNLSGRVHKRYIKNKTVPERLKYDQPRHSSTTSIKPVFFSSPVRSHSPSSSFLSHPFV